MIPKLTGIIVDKINQSQEFFSEAIIEYHAKHGKEAVTNCMHVFFNDVNIMQTRTNPIYYDSDD
jgi:hypothetical protein